jgi:anti-anti-sigma regulatory factor
VSLAIRCQRERGDAGQVLTVSGQLTSRTRRRLLEKMHALAARREGPLTVDVSNLSYFDSVSLTMLLGTERVIERQLHCPVEIRGIDVAMFRLADVDA